MYRCRPKYLQNKFVKAPPIFQTAYLQPETQFYVEIC